MSDLSYSFRASLLDRETAWKLQGEFISVTPEGGIEQRFALSEVRDVHLSYVRSKYSHHWFCVLRLESGRKFTLKNRHFKGLANFEDRNSAYNAFVKGVHRALEPYRSQVRFHSGSLWAFLFSVLFVVIGVGATLLCLWAALWQGAIPFGVLTLVLVGTLGRLKPRDFEPSAIPQGLLPPE